MKENFYKVPPILITSVPKGGTHLLNQIMMGLPIKGRGIFSSFTLDYVEDHLSRLKLLKNNEFGYGHTVYTKEYADMIHNLNLKHIFIYRDPRDVLVSFSYHIAMRDHSLHLDFLTKYVTQKQRLLVLLRGIKLLNFYELYLPYYQWLNENRTFHISFEKLVQSEQSRKTVLLKLVQYLWKDEDPSISFHTMVNNMVANINPGTCPSFRLGKIGSWQTEFDEEIKAEFKQRAGDLLIQFGYEKDNNW